MSITIDQCLEMAKLIPLMSPVGVFAVLGVASTVTMAFLSFLKSNRTSAITLRIIGLTLVSIQGVSFWLWTMQNPDWMNLITTMISYIE